MKKNLLKTMLVAVGLAAGTMGAWAETEIFSEDFSSEPYKVTLGAPSVGGIAPEVENGAASVANGGQSGDRTGYILFGENAYTGDCHLKFDMAMTPSGTSGKNNTFTIYSSGETARYPAATDYVLQLTQTYDGTIKMGDEEIGLYKGTSLTYDLYLNASEGVVNVKIYNGTDVVKTLSYTTTATGIATMHLIFNKNYGAYTIDNIYFASLEAPSVSLGSTAVAVENGGTSDVLVSDLKGNVTITSSNDGIAQGTYDSVNSKIIVSGLGVGEANLTVSVENDGLIVERQIIVRVGAIENTNVTVKYVCGEDEIVAAKSIESVIVGSELSKEQLGIEDVMYNEDQSVRYVSPTPDVVLPYVVEKDGVITVTYTAQEKVSSAIVNYVYNGTTVKAENTALTDIYEGDACVLPFSYIVVDNENKVVYKTTNNAGSYYMESVTASKDLAVNKTLSILYENVDIVLFEDLDGSDDKNGGVRASRGSAYNNQAYQSPAEIPAGCYTVMIRTTNVGRGSTLTIGEEEIFKSEQITKNNWGDLKAENIVIDGGYLNWNKGDGNTYDPLDIVLVVKPLSKSVTVGSAGLATYCPSVPLDFTGAQNIEAYKATVTTNGAEVTVTLDKVTTVAAGEGVLLRSLVDNGGDKSAEESIAVGNATAMNSGNAFVGVTETIESLPTVNADDANVTNFILNNVGGVIGFYPANNQRVAAGKAYLPVAGLNSESGAKMIAVSFGGGDTTGISEVKAEGAQTADKAYYTLSGVRVTKPAKGLYIVDGKKVVVK